MKKIKIASLPQTKRRNFFFPICSDFSKEITKDNDIKIKEKIFINFYPQQPPEVVVIFFSSIFCTTSFSLVFSPNESKCFTISLKAWSMFVPVFALVSIYEINPSLFEYSKTSFVSTALLEPSSIASTYFSL
jgi:hypothetical protein